MKNDPLEAVEGVTELKDGDESKQEGEDAKKDKKAVALQPGESIHPGRPKVTWNIPILTTSVREPEPEPVKKYREPELLNLFRRNWSRYKPLKMEPGLLRSRELVKKVPAPQH